MSFDINSGLEINWQLELSLTKLQCKKNEKNICYYSNYLYICSQNKKNEHSSSEILVAHLTTQKVVRNGTIYALYNIRYIRGLSHLR
jgi:hypothetical protein